MGGSLSLPAATIAVDESTNRLPTVEYDLRRIGAVLKVDIQFAQLRATPSFDGAVLRQLESGEQVVVIGAGFGTPSVPSFFLNVETNDSLRGWIWFGAVTLTEEEIATQNAFTPTPGVPAGAIEQDTLTQTTGLAFLVDTQLVVTKATRLRVEPGIDGYAVSELAIGDHLWSRGLQIETERETWIGVQYLGSGRTFWVAGSALESWTYSQEASANDSDTSLETSNADSPKVIVIGSESPGKNDLVESIFKVVLRHEADFGSEAVSLIPAWTQLIVTGDVVRGDSNASWLPVLDLVTGNSGWVPLQWVRLVPAEQNLIRVGARLEVKLPYNVRTEPSFQSSSLAVLDPGELAVVIETDVASEDATWIRVRLANGETGWLAIVADDPNLLFGTPVAGE